LNPETILVRARVISKQDKTYAVKLEDGYGNAEAVIHTDVAITDQNSPA